MQVDSAFHIDALEVLKCSKILRSSARAVKVYGSLPPVINSAVRLLTTLLNEYKMSTCFDALAEEIIDSGLPLEIEIAIKNSQVQFQKQYLFLSLRSNKQVIDALQWQSACLMCS